MEKLHIFLISLSAAFLLLILLFRSRRLISLAFIRFAYGRYSYEFLSTFKRLYLRSPFQYCFRDEFISHVLFILDKRDEIPVLKTFREIQFQDQSFFTDYKDFLRKKGRPYCFNAFTFDKPYFEIKVLGYQEIIFDRRAIAAYYFIDNVFFMGEHIFKDTSKEIGEKCIRPYISNDLELGDNFYVENTHDRIIHYQDTGFNIDIKYLTREDDGIIGVLKEYHDNMTSRTLNVET